MMFRHKLSFWINQLKLTHLKPLFSIQQLKGDITQKGYEKKRQRLLGHFLNSNNGSQSQSAAAAAGNERHWKSIN